MLGRNFLKMARSFATIIPALAHPDYAYEDQLLTPP